jgi:hypothetical protein
MDENHHLASMRLAGSNPVFRKKKFLVSVVIWFVEQTSSRFRSWGRQRPMLDDVVVDLFECLAQWS